MGCMLLLNYLPLNGFFFIGELILQRVPLNEYV